MNGISISELSYINGGETTPISSSYEAGYSVGNWLGVKAAEALDIFFYVIDGFSPLD